jgi:hypothetical protein
MQQAQQDTLVLSGFLNHFKWNDSGKSAFIFLSVSDQDMQGNTVYKSIPMTVTSKLANMLGSKYEEIKNARAQNQKHPVLIQVYMGKVSSYSPPQSDGSEGFPSVQLTAFRGIQISMDQNRTTIDDSEAPQWSNGGQAPQQQQGGFQQQAPAQQQQAPQQQGGFPQGQQAPQQDFDDDIPF